MEVPVTYNLKDGQSHKTMFEEISFDGKKWYWVDKHALNMDLISKYPETNNKDKKFYDGKYFGSTNIFGTLPISVPVNSQMIDNAFNSEGKIIYKSTANVSQFADFSDPKAALNAFNDNLDRAANSWNESIDSSNPVFIKSDDSSAKPTLLISADKGGINGATLSGNTGIGSLLTKYALDKSDANYNINILFITMRHEFGHSLGLNHTSHGQYYEMPDDYRLSDDGDVMNAILSYLEGGYPATQKNISENDVNAVKLIIKNHNFMNPQH